MSPVPLDETAKEAHDRVIRKASEAARASMAVLDGIAKAQARPTDPVVFKGGDAPLVRENIQRRTRT